MTDHSINGCRVTVLNGGKFACCCRDEKKGVAESCCEVFETDDDGATAEVQAINYAQKLPAHFAGDEERKAFKAEAAKAHAAEQKAQRQRSEKKLTKEDADEVARETKRKK